MDLVAFDNSYIDTFFSLLYNNIGKIVNVGFIIFFTVLSFFIMIDIVNRVGR